MLSERFKKLAATIRFRLMLWMIVTVALLVAVAMFGVRQAYRNHLLTSFDRRLRSDVDPVTREFRQTYPDWNRFEQGISQLAFAHPFKAWFVEVYNERGVRVAAAAFNRFEPPLGKFAVDESPAPHDMLPYRLIVARVEEPGLPVCYMRIGADRYSLEDDMIRLDETMQLPSLIILLLAPLGGYILALRATRPIARIISTAARLEPTRLQERLPIRGAGDELDQLSQTINGLLDRIADYLERNREFVANAAHELRSPLTAIRSSVEVALNRQRSPEEYAALLDDVMGECQFLSDLVNRLLILAEADAGRLAVRDQAARLDKIILESLDMFEPVADLNNVSLEHPELPAAFVPGDEFHLRQLVRNLLDNAIKFSPRGGRVTVALAVVESTRRAVLTVCDQGAGIPPDDVPHVFDRFFRGDKARQRQPGQHSSGLGLSICQTIVRALGGEISVASTVGTGSTFTVVVPLAAPARMPPAQARSDPRQLAAQN